MAGYTGLDIGLDVYLGSWTDAKKYLRNTAPVQITRGRQNLKSNMSPSQATMTLDNRDNRWTIRNPTGAWYGSIVQDTPCRISLPASLAGLPNYLRLEGDQVSAVTTPDVAGLQITGPIDIRVDCTPSDYSGNVLAAKWGATAKSWLFTLDALNWDHPNNNILPLVEPAGTGTLGFYWFDGTNTQFLRCNSQLPYFAQRICVRVLFTPSTGTAQFFTAPTMAGPFTQLGQNQVFGATTLPAGTGQAVQVGGGPIAPFPAGEIIELSFNSFQGMIFEAQILSNVTLEADPVFTAQAAGTTSFTDAQTRVWTLGGTSEISSRLYRFHGELAALPKAANPSSRDAYSLAQAGGIMRHLSQQQNPASSPFYRGQIRLPVADRLAAYWPAEDGKNATSLGSALGGPAMQFTTGAPSLAANSDFACSAPLPVMNNAILTGVVPPGITWQDNDVRWLWEVPAGGETDGAFVAQMWMTGGGVAYVSMVYHTGGFVNTSCYNAAGSLLFSTGNVGGIIANGGKFRMSIALKKNGSNTDLAVFSLTPGAATGGFTSHATVATSPPGAVQRVSFGGAGISQSVMGHFSVQAVDDNGFDITGPLNAWLGETAATRFRRICAEEGIPYRIIGSELQSQAMGLQTQQTIPALLQECETTDQGMMFEPLGTVGLGYITARALCNQPAISTWNYAAAQVDKGFSPVSDDTLIVNDVTMTGSDGSTARSVLTSGAMSVASPPSGVGRFDTGVTVNPGNDSQLSDLAGWFRHVRTADEDRYQQIPFQLARGTQPAALLLADIGSYIPGTNLPPWVPPGPVRQLVAGYTETIGPQPLHALVFNGIPEAPYETALADSAHAQTPGSTVHANASFGAGTFTADSISDLWTTAAGAYPFDLMIAGQQITVSGCSGASSPQTFTVSAWGVNGVQKNLVAGQQILLYRRPYAAL